MKKLICMLLGLVTFFLILLLPESIIDSWMVKATAAVTILMIIWWITEAVPIEATALVPLIGFPLLGVLSPGVASSAYGDKIIFLFLGGFIIAISMQRWNLHRRIALNIIKKVGTSPKKLILGFMVATGFLSMWISNTATAMMMIPIAIAIIATILPNYNSDTDEMTTEQKDFSAALVISIAYAASIGGIATIIGTPPNGIFVSQLQAIFPGAPTIDFFSWMMFGVPLAALMIPLSWLWLVSVPFRHIPKTLAHTEEIIDSELEILGSMGRGEKWTLLVFVLTALMWIFSTTKEIGGVTIPGLSVIFPGIDDSTIAIIGALLLFCLPVDIKKGLYVMNWEWAKKIPWGILILFGGGICLSKAFIESGLADRIVQYLSALDALPIILIVSLIVLVVSFLTEVTSNTAIASVMMPITAVTAISLLVHPYLFMIGAALAASLAFMLPVATPPNAVAYGTGYIKLQEMAKTGFALNMMGVLLITIFMFTVIPWALGFDPFSMPAWAISP